MNPGQPTVSAQKTAAAAATRVAAMTVVALATALAPLPPDAGTMAAESDFPHANAEVAEIARPHPEDKTPDNLGFADRVQDWLARANREYQTTVIPRLSIPSAGGAVADGDAIAKKLKEVKEQDAEAAEAAARATEALKAAEAKQAEEARQRAADAKRAEKARKVAEDAKRAEEARKAAEQAKRDEDARKAVQEAKAQEPPAPRPQPPPQAAPPKPDDGAALAEAKSKERERIEAEAARIEADREAAEVQRRADEAKRLEDERVKAAAKLAEAKLAEERQRVAAVEAEKNTTREIESTPEPIPPAGDAASQKFPSGNDSHKTDEDLKDNIPVPQPRSGNIQATSHTLARGPAVERWVRRVRYGHCRFAGRRITPPGHYTVRRGDSLWLISRRHYRTGWLYRKLYRANRSTIRNPNLIHPCQRIFVPRRRS
jgi:nucleoid-associated protein YgaU